MTLDNDIKNIIEEEDQIAWDKILNEKVTYRPKYHFDGIDQLLYPTHIVEDLGFIQLAMKQESNKTAPKYKIEQFGCLYPGGYFAFNSEIYQKVKVETIDIQGAKEEWNSIKLKNNRPMWFGDTDVVDLITNFEDLGLTRRQIWLKKVEQVRQRFIMWCRITAVKVWNRLRMS